MSIYTYESARIFCEALGLEFHESPAVSDQELEKIPEDLSDKQQSTDYISGFHWITDGNTNTYHHPSKPIPDGWKYGRNFIHPSTKDPEKWSKTSSRTSLAQWNDPILREKTIMAMRKPRKQKTCPHCGLVGAGGNMMRYHFNNCKVNV